MGSSQLQRDREVFRILGTPPPFRHPPPAGVWDPLPSPRAEGWKLQDAPWGLGWDVFFFLMAAGWGLSQCRDSSQSCSRFSPGDSLDHLGVAGRLRQLRLWRGQIHTGGTGDDQHGLGTHRDYRGTHRDRGRHFLGSNPCQPLHPTSLELRRVALHQKLAVATAMQNSRMVKMSRTMEIPFPASSRTGKTPSTPPRNWMDPTQDSPKPVFHGSGLPPAPRPRSKPSILVFVAHGCFQGVTHLPRHQPKIGRAGRGETTTPAGIWERAPRSLRASGKAWGWFPRAGIPHKMGFLPTPGSRRS